MKPGRPPARIPRELPHWQHRGSERDHPKHREYVRSLGCVCSASGTCGGRMHAHHVRSAANAGTGLKPPDSAVVGLCAQHHQDLHNHGADTFERQHSIDLAAEAAKLWARSPYRTDEHAKIGPKEKSQP